MYYTTFDIQVITYQKSPSLGQIGAFLWPHYGKKMEYPENTHLFHLMTTTHLSAQDRTGAALVRVQSVNHRSRQAV